MGVDDGHGRALLEIHGGVGLIFMAGGQNRKGGEVVSDQLSVVSR
jgi:hypothetical protein